MKKFQANVQNIYKKKYSDSLLVASNSLPSYATQPIVTGKKQNVLSGTFTGDTFTIIDHGYYTGESVYYTPQKIVTTSSFDVIFMIWKPKIVSTNPILSTELFSFLEMSMVLEIWSWLIVSITFRDLWGYENLM